MEETPRRITIRLAAGPITAVADGKTTRARGIPYATAARFQKPHACKPWEDVRDCTQPASICPLNPSRLGLVNGDLEKGRTQDEDCLHVSVAAPDSAQDAPFMVFLHRGPWVSGGGEMDSYNPHQLASRGAVAVTVTHRLGTFGYVPIADVAPANLGLLDQIAALNGFSETLAHLAATPPT